MYRHSIKYYQHIIFGFLLVLSVISCDSQTSVTTLKRPATVPSNAIWVGGIDGGVYVLIAKQANRDKQIYNGNIYFENGEQWYSGKMKLIPEYSTFTDIRNKDNYSGWDGEVLYLTKGRSLKALEKID